MPIKFKIHEKTLKSFEKQRKCWLNIGFFFVPMTIVVILEWDEIVALKYNLWLLISIVMAGIGIMWWFWTMLIIRKLISYRIIEIQILNDTTEDLKSLTNDIKKTKPGK